MTSGNPPIGGAGKASRGHPTPAQLKTHSDTIATTMGHPAENTIPPAPEKPPVVRNISAAQKGGSLKPEKGY